MPVCLPLHQFSLVWCNFEEQSRIVMTDRRPRKTRRSAIIYKCNKRRFRQSIQRVGDPEASELALISLTNRIISLVGSEGQISKNLSEGRQNRGDRFAPLGCGTNTFRQVSEERLEGSRRADGVSPSLSLSLICEAVSISQQLSRVELSTACGYRPRREPARKSRPSRRFCG